MSPIYRAIQKHWSNYFQWVHKLYKFIEKQTQWHAIIHCGYCNWPNSKLMTFIGLLTIVRIKGRRKRTIYQAPADPAIHGPTAHHISWKRIWINLTRTSTSALITSSQVGLSLSQIDSIHVAKFQPIALEVYAFKGTQILGLIHEEWGSYPKPVPFRSVLGEAFCLSDLERFLTVFLRQCTRGRTNKKSQSLSYMPNYRTYSTPSNTLWQKLQTGITHEHEM